MQASGLLQAAVALSPWTWTEPPSSMDKWMDGSQTYADAMNERKMLLPQNKS